MALEVTSVFEACRANARRQTEIGVVGDRDRLVVLFDLDHRSHRTKDFLARNPHAVVNLGEQRRLQIEAGIVTVENLAAPVELRALLLAEGDIAKVLIKLAPIDHRPYMRAGPQCVVDHQALHAFGQGFDEAIVNAPGDDQPGGCGTALPGRKECTIGRAFDGIFEVGVVEDDERVLAAHLKLHLLHWRRHGRRRRDTFRPVATEPVNDTAAMPGCRSKASPISLPRPMTRLKTPGGSPDFAMIPARACAEPGTRSAGLNTTQLPYASAGAIFQAGIATGKFQGVINATMPTGSRVISTS